MNKAISTALKSILWDLNLSVEEATLLISNQKSSVKGVTAHDLYLKLLMSYSWYTLIDLFGIDFVTENMLAKPVITRLFPPELKQRYLYVRSALL